MADAVQVKFEADIRDLKNGLNQVSAGLKKLQTQSANTAKQVVKQNQAMTASFNNLKSSIVKVGFVIGTAAAAFNALRAGINIASDIQKVNQQLNAVTNSAQEFARASELTYQVAQATGTSFSDTATVLTRFTFALKESGNSIEEAAIVADSLNKALYITGATGAEATSVLTQISQALSKGELNGDEFRSLAENSGYFLDILADSLGVAKSELKELGAQGKITTQDIVNAAKKGNAELSKLASETPLTLERQLTQARNSISKTLSDSEEFKRITATVGEALVALINGFSEFASTAAPAIGALVTVFAALAKAIGAVVGSAGALAAIATGVALATWQSAVIALTTGFYALYSGILKATVAMRAFVLSNPLLAAATALVIALGFAWDAMKEKQRQAAAQLAEYRKQAQTTAAAIEGLNAKQAQALVPVIAKRLELQAALEKEKAKVAELKRENTASNALLIIQLSNNLKGHQAEIDALYEKERAYASVLRQINATFAAQQQSEDVYRTINDAIISYRTLGVEITNVAKAQETVNESIKKLGGEQFVTPSQRKEFEALLKAAADADARANKPGKEPKLAITKEDTSILDEYNAAMEGLRGTWLSLAPAAEQAKAAQLDLQVQLALYREAAKAAGIAVDESLVASILRFAKAKEDAAMDDLNKQWAEATTILTDAQKEAAALADELQRIADVGKLLGKTPEEIKAAQEAYIALGQAIKKSAEEEEAARVKREEGIATMKELGDTVASGLGSIFEAVLDGSKKASDAVRALLKELLILLAKKAILSAFGLPGGFGSFGAGGASATSAASVRVFNYSGSQATARIRSDGSIDVNINALAGAIAKGGNSFDAALRRTYGIQRVGS